MQEPDIYWALCHEADELLNAGNYADALKGYTAITQRYTTDLFHYWALARRSITHYLMDNIAATLADLDTMGSTNHDTHQVTQPFLRAAALIAQKEWDKAALLHQQIYNQLVTHRTPPHRVYDYYFLYLLGSFEIKVAHAKFVAALTQLIDERPYAVYSRWIRGLAYRTVEDWQNACVDYAAAAEQAPANTALQRWSLAARQLQHGHLYAGRRQRLLAGSEGMTVDFDMDFREVTVTRFNQTSQESDPPLSIAGGERLVERYVGDPEWILVAYQSHKEGYHYGFWRPPV